ncbi:hypothetical protein N9Y17_00810 [Gammaproteobacteria bacterium]|nr:hypothetical protein [Gammaproteobacteria bacterium]
MSNFKQKRQTYKLEVNVQDVGIQLDQLEAILSGQFKASKGQSTNQNKNQNQNLQMNVNQQKNYAQSLTLAKKQVHVEKNGEDTTELLFPAFRQEIVNIKQELKLGEVNSTVLLPNPVHGISAISQAADDKMKELGITDICVDNLPMTEHGRFYLKPVYLKSYYVEKELDEDWNGYLIDGKLDNGKCIADHCYQFYQVHSNRMDEHNIQGEHFQLCYDDGVDQREILATSDDIFAPYTREPSVQSWYEDYTQFSDIDFVDDQTGQGIFSEQQWLSFIRKEPEKITKLDLKRFYTLVDKDQNPQLLAENQKLLISDMLKANIPLHVLFQAYGAKGITRLVSWYDMVLAHLSKNTFEIKEITNGLRDRQKLVQALDHWEVFEVEALKLVQSPDTISLLSVLDQNQWVRSIKQVNYFAKEITKLSDQLKSYQRSPLSVRIDWVYLDQANQESQIDYGLLADFIAIMDQGERSVVLYRLLEVLKRVDNPQQVIDQFILNDATTSSEALKSVFSEHGLYQAVAVEGIDHIESSQDLERKRRLLVDHGYKTEKNGLSHLSSGDETTKRMNHLSITCTLTLASNSSMFGKVTPVGLCQTSIKDLRALEIAYYDLFTVLENDNLLKVVDEITDKVLSVVIQGFLASDQKEEDQSRLSSASYILTKYAQVLMTAKQCLGPNFKLFWNHLDQHFNVHLDQESYEKINPDLATSLSEIDAILKDASLSVQVKALAPCFSGWQASDFSESNMALLANYTFHKKIMAGQKLNFTELLNQSNGQELSPALIAQFQLEQLEDLGDPHYLTKKLRIALKNNSELGGYFPALNVPHEQREINIANCKSTFDHKFGGVRNFAKDFETHYHACVNNWYADDKDSLESLKNAQMGLFMAVVKLKQNRLVKSLVGGVLDTILKEMTGSLNQSVEISLKRLESKLSEKCPTISEYFQPFYENCKLKYHVDVNDLQGDGNHSEKLELANETAPKLIESFQTNLESLSDVIDYQVFFENLKSLEDQDQLVIGEQFLTWYAQNKDDIWVLSSQIIKHFFACSPEQRKQFERCDWRDPATADFQFEACRSELNTDQINMIKAFSEEKQEAWLNHFSEPQADIQQYLRLMDHGEFSSEARQEASQEAFLDPTCYGHFGQWLCSLSEGDQAQFQWIKSALVNAYHQGGIEKLPSENIDIIKGNLCEVAKKTDLEEEIKNVIKRHGFAEPSFSAWSYFPDDLFRDDQQDRDNQQVKDKIENWLYRFDIQADSRQWDPYQGQRLTDQLQIANAEGVWCDHEMKPQLKNQLDYFEVAAHDSLKMESCKNKLALRYWGTSKLINAIKKLKNTIDGNVSHKDNKLALACLRELFYRATGKFPNQTQIMSVWISLTNPTVGLNINTGEGKSITSALIAAMRWVQGYQTSVVTSDSVLAARDLSAVKPFFKLLNIDSGLIDGSSQGEPCFKDVVYSTPSDLELYFGQAVQAGWQLGPQNQALVLDEADNHLIDSQHDYNLVQGGGNHQSPNKGIYRSIAQFISGHADIISQDLENTGVENFFAQLLMHLQSDDQIKDDLAAVFDGQIDWHEQNTQQTCERWLMSAIKAWQVLQSNLHGDKTHYVINTVNKFGRQYQVCTLYDAQNRQDPDAQYNNGVQAFLHTFHDLAGQGDFWVEDDPQLYVTSNFNRLAKRYVQSGHVLTGITGTFGSQQEIKYLQEKYGIQFWKVPTNLESIRVETQKYFEINQKKQEQKLIKLINKNQGRPILVFAQNTDQDADRLFSSLQGKLGDRELINVCKMDQDEEKQALQQTFSNQVIIANDKWGRGTDLKLDQQAKKHGLLVIQTCPLHKRGEDQRFGRTARYGEKGEVIELYDQPAEKIMALKEIKNNQVIAKKIAYDEQSEPKQALLMRYEQAIEETSQPSKQDLVNQMRSLINKLDSTPSEDFQTIEADLREDDVSCDIEPSIEITRQRSVLPAQWIATDQPFDIQDQQPVGQRGVGLTSVQSAQKEMITRAYQINYPERSDMVYGQYTFAVDKQTLQVELEKLGEKNTSWSIGQSLLMLFEFLLLTCTLIAGLSAFLTGFVVTPFVVVLATCITVFINFKLGHQYFYNDSWQSHLQHLAGFLVLIGPLVLFHFMDIGVMLSTLHLSLATVLTASMVIVPCLLIGSILMIYINKLGQEKKVRELLEEQTAKMSFDVRLLATTDHDDGYISSNRSSLSSDSGYAFSQSDKESDSPLGKSPNSDSISDAQTSASEHDTDSCEYHAISIDEQDHLETTLSIHH